MVGQDPEMLQMFLEESREHLNSLEADLLTLEDTVDAPEQELINRIFRSVHSLKGSAGFFGFENITNLSHVMENLFSLIRDGKMKPYSGMITSLLDGKDRLTEMIDDVDNSESIDIRDEMKRLNEILSNGGQADKNVLIKPKNIETLPERLYRQFEISVSELEKAVGHGRFLYSVHAYTKKDMKNKGKTPFDYLQGIKKLGNLIASYSDISEIGGLDDNLTEKDISFVFLFSSVLEPDLIALGLEVEESQVELLEVPDVMKETKKEKITSEENTTENDLTHKSEEDNLDSENNVDSTNGEVADSKSRIVKNESSKHSESIRVSVPLLNDLMTFAGELVLARNQLLRMTEDISKTVPGLQNVLQDINMTTSLLQEKIMNTRMQPISTVFNKFPRVIRDLSNKLKKDIKLEVTGNDVDLDKSIIEVLSDPLTHLIRNSADHGIELPSVRQKAGKPSVGTIWLKAYHEGGKVNIDVVDDGRGINRENILKKAIDKGIVTESEAKIMSDKNVYSLIFAAGFSTAEEVSDVSGRGVGMDVVRTNIEKLGGSVSVDSEKGKGTVVNLKLPLTLAIIPSLIVTVQNQNFALPQVSLRELVRIKKGEGQHKIEMVNNAPVLRLRNKLLPIVYLADVLGLPKNDENQEIIRVLVLQQDENEFGLVVDNIFDSEEIVVKSIPRFFKKSMCYSGTTTMSDGTVALILDIAGIASKAKLNFSAIQTKTESKEDSLRKDTQEKQNLLLFENADDEFFALNLDLIKRIEKINQSEIEIVGDKKYIEHEGKSLRIIQLEDFLPVKVKQNPGENIYVIIPTWIENPIGIIAHKIIDSISVNANIDTESITAKGLIGSALIDKRIVLFPDIYSIAEMADPEKTHRYHSDQNEKIKILLVEDTPFFRSLVKQYFESVGYKVDLAVDGMDAMKKLQKNKYQAFVVDIIMPRMDGFEFAKAVRSNEEYDTTPLIALTTLSDDVNRSKATEIGFDAYEIKVHKEHLLETVKKLLNKKKSISKQEAL
ncbi:MAG: hybrid sensor histidine kinase/response regulator [Candidatus Cloacimonetes bacterium]|nr:hybrid sensor histidine kinase/response regulator [Candidatus Cloacimonadota bacterium]